MRIFIVAVFCLISAVCAFGQEYRMVGKIPVASMVLTDLSGSKLDTRQLAGKIVVYNLWFVGCPPCMEEIPKLNEIAQQYKSADVVFVGLSTSSAADVNKFLTKQPFDYRLVPAAGREMLMNFGLPDKSGTLNVAFPTHVVVNREGYIEYRSTGIKGIEGIRTVLDKAIANK